MNQALETVSRSSGTTSTPRVRPERGGELGERVTALVVPSPAACDVEIAITTARTGSALGGAIVGLGIAAPGAAPSAGLLEQFHALHGDPQGSRP